MKCVYVFIHFVIVGMFINTCECCGPVMAMYLLTAHQKKGVKFSRLLSNWLNVQHHYTGDGNSCKNVINENKYFQNGLSWNLLKCPNWSHYFFFWLWKHTNSNGETGRCVFSSNILKAGYSKTQSPLTLQIPSASKSPQPQSSRKRFRGKSTLSSAETLLRSRNAASLTDLGFKKHGIK